MIQKEYKDFRELYLTELLQRSFDINHVNNGVMIAKYQGNSILRSEDSGIGVTVEKQKDQWILKAPDSFYANRILFNLGPSKKERTGQNCCGQGLYGMRKRFSSESLEKGIKNSTKYILIEQPYSMYRNSTTAVGIFVARSRIQEHIAKGFEIYGLGFTDEDKEVFSLVGLVQDIGTVKKNQELQQMFERSGLTLDCNPFQDIFE